MTRSVDPCSAGPLAAVGAAAFLAWTEGLEWCCANLDEGRALTGAARPKRSWLRLRRHYREVVVTLGAEGALFSGPGTDLPPLSRGPGRGRRHDRGRRRLHGDLPGPAPRRRWGGTGAAGWAGGRRPGGGRARRPFVGLRAAGAPVTGSALLPAVGDTVRGRRAHPPDEAGRRRRW